MRETPEYFYSQSAVIPYRRDDQNLEILMITSRKKKRWVIPKGVIEPHLSPTDSAVKEALEEAGIEGKVSERPIGSYKYEKWGGTCTVEVYTMKVHTVLDDWLENYRDREWVSVEEAVGRVTEPRLKEIVCDLPLFLKGEHV